MEWFFLDLTTLPDSAHPASVTSLTLHLHPGLGLPAEPSAALLRRGRPLPRGPSVRARLPGRDGRGGAAGGADGGRAADGAPRPLPGPTGAQQSPGQHGPLKVTGGEGEGGGYHGISELGGNYRKRRKCLD